MLSGVQDHLPDPGRLERVGDQLLRGIIPQEQIHSLAVELIDDLTDSATAHPHADADRIDARDAAAHGQLTARAGFAGKRFNLDDPGGDFGNLLGKETCDAFGFIRSHQSGSTWPSVSEDLASISPVDGVAKLLQ